MAEKKTPTIVSASGGNTKPNVVQAKPVGNATGYRVGAIILWVLAIVCEILAVLVVFGKLTITFINTMWMLIILIVLDLVFVIIGSQLWKKANHIKPASEKNAVLFWLWNNMGVVVACFAFVPIIIIMLTNKNLDKKTKTVAVIAAAVALLIGGAASVDYNPVSAEQLEAAEAAINQTVYWTPYGKAYHTHVIIDENGEITESCPYLNRSDTLTAGTVEEAIAAGRTKLCSYCQRKDNISETVATDEKEIDASELAE